MKPKLIKEGESFTLHNTTWTYSVIEDRVVMRKVEGVVKKDLSATSEVINKNANTINNGQSKRASNKKQLIPPTLNEVSLFFNTNGYSSDGAKLAYNYYNDGDWTDRNGDPVINWKQKIRINWFKPEYKIVDKNGENNSLIGMVM